MLDTHIQNPYAPAFTICPSASVCVCLSIIVIAFVYMSASIVYLSICMRLSIASICVFLPLPMRLSGPVCLPAGLPVYLLLGNHSVCLSVFGLYVASLSVCVSVTTRLNISVRLPTS